jgi:hypothetical protein
VAFITASDKPAATATVSFAQLGVKGKTCTMRDIWAKKSSSTTGGVSFTFPAAAGKGQYQSGLLALTQCK